MMRTTLQKIGAIFSLLCFQSVLANKPVHAQEVETIDGRTMGTSYRLSFVRGEFGASGEGLASEVSAELERIEGIFSLYRSDSEICLLNASPADKWISTSQDLFQVAQYAVSLSKQTGGALDPTLHPLIELWQGDRLSSNWLPPSPKDIAAARSRIGTSLLEFKDDPPSIRKLSSEVQLDLNALVEGWAIDRILNLLKKQKCVSALFELGGEHAAFGVKPNGKAWRIGIENPQDPASLYATVTLNEAAMCTSGSYRQARKHAGRSYSHILDPRTGNPVAHNLIAVSVLHPNAMVADGWATALMVLGPVEGPELAEECGLAASFVVGSSTSISPQLSDPAVGLIDLVSESPSWRFPVALVGLAAIALSGSMFTAWLLRRRGGFA